MRPDPWLQSSPIQPPREVPSARGPAGGFRVRPESGLRQGSEAKVVLLLLLSVPLIGCGEHLSAPQEPSPGGTPALSVAPDEWDGYCDDFLENGATTCAGMNFIRKHYVMSLFEDGYRSDSQCGRMRSSLWTALELNGYDGEGTAAGLSAYWGGGAVVGVWFHNRLFGTSVSLREKQRVFGHEGYHLAFESDDHELGNWAAEYCFGYRHDSPWGYEV